MHNIDIFLFLFIFFGKLIILLSAFNDTIPSKSFFKQEQYLCFLVIDKYHCSTIELDFDGEIEFEDDILVGFLDGVWESGELVDEVEKGDLD
jgi:hypothetical protein